MVREPGGRLLLHHPDERELPASGDAAKASSEGILKGMYLLCAKAATDKKAPRVQLLGSGTILREVIAAAELLKNDWGVAADMWSCPSFTELRARRPGGRALEPAASRREAARCRTSSSASAATQGPVVAATDYMRTFADQIRAVRAAAATRCSAPTASAAATTREKLRRFFEVDRHYVAVAALKALADDGAMPAGEGGRGDQEIRHRPRASPRPGRCSSHGPTRTTRQEKHWPRSR